jgi:conjugal transfer pilus assembly protein TraI
MLALRAFLLGRGAPASRAAHSLDEASAAVPAPRPHDGPRDERSIPNRSVDDILAPHAELIARIKLAYGADRATFEREVLAPIRNYAADVHLLPATADDHFSDTGGLLQLGLEIAFFSLQATDGQIFSGRSTISVRRELEPRWRLATFIAGLCHEVHRTLSHLTVTDRNGEDWPAYLIALTPWLRSRRADRYFIRWTPDATETRGLGLFALQRIVTLETLQHLSAGNAATVPHLLASVSGTAGYRERNVLDELVRRSAALVIDRDLLARAQRRGKPIAGSHLERYLVDALRHLAASNPAWRPNGEKSRVWFGRDGLFVVWPNAAADLRRLLESERWAGIPHAADDVLQVLVAAGAVEPRSETEATWTIRPPGSAETFDAIKLKAPAVLYAGVDDAPAPVQTDLLATPAVRPRPPATELPVAIGTPAPTAEATRLPTQVQHQIPLNLDAAGSTAASHSRQPATSRGHRVRLDAPSRLNPLVRDALDRIVATLNDDPQQAFAMTTLEGLFVPLSQFERLHVDPPIAMRSLDAAGMLVRPSAEKSKTVVRDDNGKRIVGVVIAKRFIAGPDSGASASESADRS